MITTPRVLPILLLQRLGALPREFLSFSSCYLFRNPFSSTTVGDENPIRTLGDYSKPSHEEYKNTIELLIGNNVVPLRSDTIRLVQNGCSFYGLRSEDPNQHLKDFLKLVDSLDLDGENRERTRLHRKTPQRYPDVPTTSWRISIRSMDSFQGLTPKSPSSWHRPLASKSWALFEDLALYDNESWNDPRDFAKPVKAIALPQDVPSTFDCRLIELENQVQRLMEAYLAPTQTIQVNKVSSSCEICSGPHDTQYCMKNPEQAFVDYASLRTNEVGGGSVSIHSSSYQIKLEKALLDFDSHQEKRLSHLKTQLGQQQDDMIGKINLLRKIVSEKLKDASPLENAGNSMALKALQQSAMTKGRNS
ncbi:hypothetical protein Tco_0178923 [Tanacetum coccineum]